MKTMLKTFYAKPLAACLTAAILAITTFAGPAEAMFVTSGHQAAADPAAASAVRKTDLAGIRAALESKIVHQKLVDLGLSPEEAMARVDKLPDEQISSIATNMNSLQAGGDGSISLVALLLIIILVILIVQAPGNIDMADNNAVISHTEGYST